MAATRIDGQGRAAKQWSIVLGGVLGALLLSTSTQANSWQEVDTAPPAATEVTEVVHPPDGVYFYGAVPQADELGVAYMVFEAQGTAVVGAMFMPYSSFDCFTGNIDGRELALQITHSYTAERYDYAIAVVAADAPIAAIGDAAVPLQLDGFFNLGTPRESELAILSTCQSSSIPEAELEL